MKPRTVADDGRREVARRLREIELSIGGYVAWWKIAQALGLKEPAGWFGWEKFEPDSVNHLADLIDPACEAYRDALFYPATGLTPEHEETVYRCGKCDEVVSDDEGYDPETDLPAYCERCGSRIIGIGEL